MSNIAGDPVYIERARTRYPMNLSDASRELGVTVQRLSRYLKLLKVPVTRQGYAVLVDSSGIARVRKALKNGEVKRGRKKKAS